MNVGGFYSESLVGLIYRDESQGWCCCGLVACPAECVAEASGCDLRRLVAHSVPLPFVVISGFHWFGVVHIF